MLAHGGFLGCAIRRVCGSASTHLYEVFAESLQGASVADCNGKASSISGYGEATQVALSSSFGGTITTCEGADANET